jgi:hypothetical protein
MTKQEREEIKRAIVACNLGMADMAARTISALYRAASTKAQPEILAEAHKLNIHLLPDFII